MTEELIDELERDTLVRHRFFVPGTPASTNDLYRRNRFGQLFRTGEAKAWASAVGWAAKQAGVRREPERGVKVSILYCHHGRKRCDLDNILKVTFDGLNGVAWTDDRQIVELFVQVQSVSVQSQAGLLLTLRVLNT